MALTDLFQSLFWGRRGRWDGGPPTPSRRLPPGKPARIAVGARVRLRIPIAGPHTVYIPAGAVGVVVGGHPKARRVSVELDTPRTVVTVPFAWVEAEPAPDPPATVPGPAPS
ncbi:MAG TPA: hypothetical protein VLD61_03975 [Methylomirabilota bacterium]|nr:hypothetical protein [Methylomirabilota bacterium]